MEGAQKELIDILDEYGISDPVGLIALLEAVKKLDAAFYSHNDASILNAAKGIQ